MAKVLTGLSIGCIEAFILCPVERLKVFMMTRKANQSVYQSLTGKFAQELYRGY